MLIAIWELFIGNPNVPVTEFSGEPDEVGIFWMYLTHTSCIASSHSNFFQSRYSVGNRVMVLVYIFYYYLVGRVLLYI